MLTAGSQRKCSELTRSCRRLLFTPLTVGCDRVPLLSVDSQACQVPEIVEQPHRQRRELVLLEQIAFDR